MTWLVVARLAYIGKIYPEKKALISSISEVDKIDESDWTILNSICQQKEDTTKAAAKAGLFNTVLKNK